MFAYAILGAIRNNIHHKKGIYEKCNAFTYAEHSMHVAGTV